MFKSTVVNNKNTIIEDVRYLQKVNEYSEQF